MFQLATNRADLQKLLIQTYDARARQLRSSVEFVLGILSQFISVLPVVYFILDGVDELSEPERSFLLRDILELQDTMKLESKTLKILLGSRAEDDIVRALSVRAPILRVQDNNTEDIKNYVNQKADSWLKGQWASSQTMSKIRQLMQPIAVHADGMFLYARLVCDSIILKGDLDAVEEAVKDLPIGLNEAYGRVISRIEDNLYPSESGEAKFILGLIGSSLVPMSVYEIRLALSAFHNRDLSRGCKDLFLNVLQRCGAIVEEVDGKVQFVHFTLYEYLYGSQSGFYLNEEQSHRNIATVCLRYLASPCFDTDVSATQLSDRVLSGTYVLENYVCTHWTEHLKKASAANAKKLEPDLKYFLVKRSNPSYSGQSANGVTLSGGPRSDDWLLEEKLSTVLAFARSRKMELCLSDGALWKDDDPLTISEMQLRIIDCLESSLCPKTLHHSECQCAELKILYGNCIIKCRRLGCPFHRIGFQTQDELTRHMKMHTRPHKCDRDACEFSELGFRTQALLTHHLKSFHSQSLSKDRAAIGGLVMENEFKLILQDAIRQDDLDLVRDMWKEGRRHGLELLLTAIEEGSSHGMTEYLVNHVKLENNFPGLQKVLLAAAEKVVIPVFETYNIQQLIISYRGEKVVTNILYRVAASRSSELVRVVWRQVPPVFYAEFVSRLIPGRPDQHAEALTVECLQVIVDNTPPGRLRSAFEQGLRTLGAKCCSISIAEFLLQYTREGMDSLNTPITAHTPLYHASGKTTPEAANLMKYLLEKGANPQPAYQWKRIDLSQRPGPQNIQQWLGLTWSELVSKTSNIPSTSPSDHAPEPFHLDFSTLENSDVLENFDFDSFLNDPNSDGPFELYKK